MPISTVLQDIVPNYDDVIVMGDFNENILKSPPKAQTTRFVQSFTQLSLHLLSSLPTHFFSTGSSLLDLAFTKNARNMSTFTQLDNSLSNHDILVARYISSVPITESIPIYKRQLNRINAPNLLNDALSMPYHNIYYMTDIDDMVSSFELNTSILLDKHAPLVISKATTLTNQPWFSSVVQCACALFEI